MKTPPELAERIHVERHVIRFTIDIRNGRIHVVIELAELVHVIPYAAQRGVEDVRTITMHINALDLFGIDIASNMITAIDNEAFLTKLFLPHVQKTAPVRPAPTIR